MFNNKLARFVIISALGGVLTAPAFAASSADLQIKNPWLDATTSLAARADFSSTENKNVLTLSGRPLTADLTSLVTQLDVLSDFSFPLPLPDGTFANYQFSRSSVMATGLAEKYPLIQTFTATDLSNPQNSGRFDITPKGFHGMFKHDGRWVFIDPELRTRTDQYISYYRDNALPLVRRSADQVFNSNASNLLGRPESAIRAIVGGVKRTYRLALSTSAEYVAFHGGTKEDGIAAVVTMLNRVNEVFERDLSITFELVENNDKLIYTDAATDPFQNNDDDLEIIPQLLSSEIGDDEFDIGHVLNTGGGGLAALGVCDPTLKALGMTGTDSPTGDAFYIDYVAHEIGHQLGANHSFNGTNSFCQGNRNALTAWEPGSGSSIMSYAGICGEQDVQVNASAFFHIGSIAEIQAFTEAAGCGIETALDNTSPEVDAGLDYIIPSNTPFKLSGAASDEDGDTLNYLWEQLDVGTAATSLEEMIDDGTRPLFRSWELEDHGTRYFPRLQDVLVENGYTSVGEAYPNTDRNMTFRLTVRDGKGGVSTDEVIVSVSKNTETFNVTSPGGGTDYIGGGSLNIQWDVAGTNVAPVSCSAVEILLSDNAGISFEHVLVASTPNDGEYVYTLPDESVINGRVMVRCLGNVFFAVNQSDFQVFTVVERQSIDSAEERAATSVEVAVAAVTATTVAADAAAIEAAEALTAVKTAEAAAVAAQVAADKAAVIAATAAEAAANAIAAAEPAVADPAVAELTVVEPEEVLEAAEAASASEAAEIAASDASDAYSAAVIAAETATEMAEAAADEVAVATAAQADAEIAFQLIADAQTVIVAETAAETAAAAAAIAVAAVAEAESAAASAEEANTGAADQAALAVAAEEKAEAAARAAAKAVADEDSGSGGGSFSWLLLPLLLLATRRLSRFR
jgi:hypothetical protein